MIHGAFANAAHIAGLATAALGAVGVAGWLLDLPGLKNLGYGVATMKMNTAVLLLLTGIALTITVRPSMTRISMLVARGGALLASFIGAATLAEYATGFDLDIDQMLIHAPQLSDGSPPGRMAPNTALIFALIGFAQALFDSARRAARMAAQIASLLVLSIAFLAVSGYFLSVDALYGVAGYTSMALPTAIAFTTLSAGLLASRPDRGVVAILAQPNSAGAALRRFLPLLVLVPLLLAGLQRVGVDTGQFGAEFGAALTATLTVCLLCLLAFRNARIHGQWDSERTRANEQVRLALEAAPNGMLIVDGRGNIVLVNAEVERLFGYSRTELIGGPVEKLVPESARRAHALLRTHYQSQPVPRAMAPAQRTLHGSHRDGGVVPVEVGLTPLRMPQGDFVLATILDVRNREQLERAAERERFFQLSNDALCIANAAGFFVQVNAAFERILGYTRAEMVAVPYTSFIHPDDVAATIQEAQKLAAGKSVVDFRNRYRGRDGAYRWLQWRSMPDQTGLAYATARDITRELEATHALQASLKERSVLLAEVHHRVKNNLQIIASMINMQVRKLTVGAARDALEECSSRVQTIGLIHETLYQASDCARIPIQDYVTRLVDNIFHAAGRSPATIVPHLDIAPVSLTVDKAIPCGLIINELVTNSLKHAFPADRHGNLQVRLRAQRVGELTLSVADDGIGLATDFEIESSASMGLVLVTTLVEQLKGRLAITRAPGTSFEIIFPLETAL